MSRHNPALNGLANASKFRSRVIVHRDPSTNNLGLENGDQPLLATEDPVLPLPLPLLPPLIPVVRVGLSLKDLTIDDLKSKLLVTQILFKNANELHLILMRNLLDASDTQKKDLEEQLKIANDDLEKHRMELENISHELDSKQIELAAKELALKKITDEQALKALRLAESEKKIKEHDNSLSVRELKLDKAIGAEAFKLAAEKRAEERLKLEKESAEKIRLENEVKKQAEKQLKLEKQEAEKLKAAEAEKRRDAEALQAQKEFEKAEADAIRLQKVADKLALKAKKALDKKATQEPPPKLELEKTLTKKEKVSLNADVPKELEPKIAPVVKKTKKQIEAERVEAQYLSVSEQLNRLYFKQKTKLNTAVESLRVNSSFEQVGMQTAELMPLLLNDFLILCQLMEALNNVQENRKVKIWLVNAVVHAIDGDPSYNFDTLLNRVRVNSANLKLIQSFLVSLKDPLFVLHDQFGNLPNELLQSYLCLMRRRNDFQLKNIPLTPELSATFDKLLNETFLAINTVISGSTVSQKECKRIKLAADNIEKQVSPFLPPSNLEVALNAVPAMKIGVVTLGLFGGENALIALRRKEMEEVMQRYKTLFAKKQKVLVSVREIVDQNSARVKSTFKVAFQIIFDSLYAISCDDNNATMMVAFLHDYAHKVKKKRPTYAWDEMKNAGASDLLTIAVNDFSDFLDTLTKQDALKCPIFYDRLSPAIMTYKNTLLKIYTFVLSLKFDPLIMRDNANFEFVIALDTLLTIIANLISLMAKKAACESVFMVDDSFTRAMSDLKEAFFNLIERVDFKAATESSSYYAENIAAYAVGLDCASSHIVPS
ncbi:MAG: hypothetical protein A3E82_05070 [Gammaproteobacteria bacterium RIFCSPHIGHO2_12_FULL_38_11]|nr:MAG: hypothetical protein A3E82_05070 [Gammaproteobacteria bacterium RIFCSPHIGHO2_12_FULL_38_11]